MSSPSQNHPPAPPPKKAMGERRRRPLDATLQAGKALGGLRRAPRAVRERLPQLRSERGRAPAGTTVEGLSPDAALHSSRNFRLGVLNGIAFSAVEALIAPTLVLAWFINALGAPNVLVGFLPAILAGGWFLRVACAALPM
jgi:hypothetical protein